MSTGGMFPTSQGQGFPSPLLLGQLMKIWRSLRFLFNYCHCSVGLAPSLPACLSKSRRIYFSEKSAWGEMKYSPWEDGRSNL